MRFLMGVNMSNCFRKDQFREDVKESYKALYKTMERFSKDFGCSRKTMSLYLSQPEKLSLDTILSICNLLHLETSHYITRR